MLRSGRRWRGLVTAAALCCAGLLLFGVASSGAGARPVVARAAGCGGGSSSGVIYSYGGPTRIVSQFDVPVCMTGRLTVTFAGDPAAGCATAGLCDYLGTDTYAPDPGNAGDINIVTIERHGHRSSTASLSVGGPSSLVTSAVQRTIGGATASCSDNVGTPREFDGSSFALPVARGRVTIGLRHAQPALLGSRCAGPLDVDLASVLPSRTISLRALEHGETTIDLTGSGQFVAHGLSGTVSSTLMLTLGRRQREKQGIAPPGPTRTRVSHVVTVAYRVAHLTGTAVATVQSSALPALCGPFDACGLEGTIAVSSGVAARGSAFLTADSSHATVDHLRTELRGRGRGKVFGAGLVNVHGSVDADLTQSGVTCTDGVALRRFSIQLVRTGRAVAVSLAPAESQAIDPFRTRCPGPYLGSHRFASAVLPADVLGRRSFTVSLRGIPFQDAPYSVTTRSTLRLTLRRGATQVHVIKLPVPDAR
ncbi:MAG TPA: hypothetical protein VGL69_13550 [Solirubrobacteraceae bacterium]